MPHHGRSGGIRHFNSRTHVECDLSLFQKRGSLHSFQLTHSRGVRPSGAGQTVLHPNFNSRTHVECDSVSYVKGSVVVISTHALTWSATSGIILYFRLTPISTHALTWSATPLPVPTIIALEFQLTHSRGVRPDIFHCVNRPIVHFNSRTHVECDSYDSLR